MSSPRQHRIVVLEPGYESYETERRLLAPFDAVIQPVAANGEPGAVAEAVRDADAVLVREAPVDGATISAMRRCRVIVRYGVGVDNIDLDAARASRIYVANVPRYGADEVSDQAMALMLAVARRVVSRDRQVRAGAWNIGQSEKIFPLRGRVLGLVGYGRIARRMRDKVLPFGIGRTLVQDPMLSEDEASADGVEVCDIDKLCREADLISLHAPLTAETRHIVNRDRLRVMQRQTILVNTARGGLVDEAALAEAVREGWIFGAGLDVFEREPPGADNPLLGLEGLVVSDHNAWYSESSVIELQTKAAEEVARVLSGARPESWLNPWEA